MAIPLRNALCLQCRTALFEGESCAIDSAHSVADMDDVYGREVLVAAVWGPRHVREYNLRSASRAQQNLTALASIGAGLGALTWALLPGVGILPLFGGLASGAVLWTCGNRMLGNRPTAYPVGAEPLPDTTGMGLGRRGEVMRAEVPGTLDDIARATPGDLDGIERGQRRNDHPTQGEMRLFSPASGTMCMAYAVQLHYQGYWGDRIMFRDAVTAGFEVELDCGRIAYIPAGRVRLVGPMHQQIDVDNLRLDRYIKAFDPRHSAGDAFDPLRFNVVYEQVIVPGDRVELISLFEPVVNARANPTHYREPAPSILAPRGVPILRLLTPTG
ncbi:MAG: hypothetical protein MJE77_00180 [Proteobacteria bacterium]|nr:hypothetical protein [Pseudomonadota bacterium]